MTRLRAFRVSVLLGLLVLLPAFAVACRVSDEPTPRRPAIAAKIFVTEEGMYELTRADLEAAGLDWGDVDPMRLRLFYRGQQQPLWVQGRDETLALRFYAQASQSRYTRENVYWLRLDSGEARQMEERSATGGMAERGPVDHYIATVHAEENRLYAPRVEEGDHWFWAFLPAPQTQTFDVALSAVAPRLDGPSAPLRGSLRVELWASSKAPEVPDHHIRVSVNGKPVADETWDGQGRHTIEADLPEGLLEEGTNVVTVEAPGDTGAAADITYVDWLDVRYPRFFVADGDRLAFESPGGQQRLIGFTGPVVVFDVTDPQDVTRVSGIKEEKQGSEVVVSFRGEQGHRYLAVGQPGFRRSARIAPAGSGPDLQASSNGADYIAIGPPDLLEPLQPLLAWREGQGLKVLAVPVEAVYDQFNHGLPEPEAIHAFLKYAAQSWQPAPQLVLLVGDATYDPRGYLTPPEANRVPSFLIPTVFGGETASDTAFAQLDDDLWPDIAVGRMPARTPQQVRTLVEKTLAYEQRALDGDWRSRVLAVADGQDPSFSREARDFIQQFPDGYQAVELFPAAGATDASQKVRQRLDEGYLLVAYFGHGSATQWGKDRIFTTADVPALANGDRLPVVVNMTCLTGLFTHPKVESLAEALLWQEEGGAVAVLAPTSLTLPTDQSFLSRALVESLFYDRPPSLGQAVLQAQSKVPMFDAGTRDVMQTFLLFGDPALRLTYP